MNNLTELRERLESIEKYLDERTLTELSGHLTHFSELFVKLYILNKNPEHQGPLDVPLGGLRAIADKIEKMPPNIAFQLESCQRFRNRIAHNRFDKKFQWGQDFLDTIRSACCTLFSFAASDFTSAGKYVGVTISISRKTYDLSTFSGRRQKEYDDLVNLYDNFFEELLPDMWDLDFDQLSTKEEDEELSDEEEMHLDDIMDVMDVADDMRSILVKVLIQYESSSFSINHTNHFSDMEENLKKLSQLANMEEKELKEQWNKPMYDIDRDSKTHEQIKPNQITDDGRWVDGPNIDLSLQGIKFSIPTEIRQTTHPELQEIIAISEADRYLQECPKCHEDISGCVLSTGYTMIYPAKCCNNFCYIVNSSKLPDIGE